MSFHFRIKLAGLFVLIATSSAQAAAPFSICAEPDNLPMSEQSSSSGFELEVAKLLAQDMGRDLQVKWVSQRDHSFYGKTIGSGECDAVMGIPSGFSKLTTTNPWYRTGFFFVTRKDAGINPHSFDDAAIKKLTIGVPATGLGDTPPAIALTQRALGSNLRPYSIYESQKLVAAVANKEIDMAIIWGPFAGWFAGNNPKLAIAPAPEKDGPNSLAFDISIGVKKGNDALKNQLDAALTHQHNAIEAVLAKWRVPVKEEN